MCFPWDTPSAPFTLGVRLSNGAQQFVPPVVNCSLGAFIRCRDATFPPPLTDTVCGLITERHKKLPFSEQTAKCVANGRPSIRLGSAT